VNGKLIFSKLSQGSFPSFKEVGIHVDLRDNNGLPLFRKWSEKENSSRSGKFIFIKEKLGNI